MEKNIIAVLSVLLILSVIAGSVVVLQKTTEIGVLESELDVLKNAEPEIVEVEVLKEVEVPVEENLELIDELKTKLEKYDDVILQKDRELSALNLVEDELKDEDLLLDLKDNLTSLGYNVEHYEDILNVKIINVEDAYLNISEEDEIEGFVGVELRVLFRQDGLDGDRHRVDILGQFVLDDEEVVHFDFV
jgi:hypothetical protein